MYYKPDHIDSSTWPRYSHRERWCTVTVAVPIQYRRLRTNLTNFDLFDSMKMMHVPADDDEMMIMMMVRLRCTKL